MFDSRFPGKKHIHLISSSVAQHIGWLKNWSILRRESRRQILTTGILSFLAWSVALFLVACSRFISQTSWKEFPSFIPWPHCLHFARFCITSCILSGLNSPAVEHLQFKGTTPNFGPQNLHANHAYFPSFLTEKKLEIPGFSSWPCTVHGRH